MFSHTHSVSIADQNGGSVGSSSIVITADSQVGFDDTIILNQADKEIDIALVAAKIVSLWIMASVAMTLKTNSTSSPSQTLTLTANVPIVWKTGQGTCPITADITKIYVTNTTAGTLSIKALQDSTP